MGEKLKKKEEQVREFQLLRIESKEEDTAICNKIVEESQNIKAIEKENAGGDTGDHLLALTAPTWAGIASKIPSVSAEVPDLPKAPELVALKHSTSQTQIIEPEQNTDECYLDEEGFELSLSRKVKRERKISKRISLSVDEEDTKNDEVECEESREQSFNNSKLSGTALPMDETSDAWMNEDVGTIESDSEEEMENLKDISITDSNDVHQYKPNKELKFLTSAEEKESQSLKSNLKSTGLPMDDTSDAWMDDDVGTLDSGSELELEEAHSTNRKNHIEPQKQTLSLMAPSWAGVASKSPSSS